MLSSVCLMYSHSIHMFNKLYPAKDRTKKGAPDLEFASHPFSGISRLCAGDKGKQDLVGIQHEWPRAKI